MHSTRHEPTTCKCGYVFDTSSSAYGEHSGPKEGDLSICINCGNPMVLDSGLWRDITANEIIDLDPSDRNKLFKAQAAQRIIQEMRKKDAGTT